jgi:hypothetical protein
MNHVTLTSVVLVVMMMMITTATMTDDDGQPTTTVIKTSTAHIPYRMVTLALAFWLTIYV